MQFFFRKLLRSYVRNADLYLPADCRAYGVVSMPECVLDNR